MEFSEAEHALINQDPDMAVLIRRNGPLVRESRGDYFASLARSIIGQQISVKAAAKIMERFEATTQMDPTVAAQLTDEQSKAIGLSGQKYRYITDLAEHFVRDSMVFNHLETLSDDEVITELTRIKGIGVWTAQMFLMFTLVRPDIFAPDDRGLQLAIQKLYDLPAVPPRSELEAIASKWAPYRTAASWHLWGLLDNEPV
jgi:DNA-3-methyladenine glycosylase II